MTDDKTMKFIERARQVHGDRYDYGEFVYVKNTIKGTIFCRLHQVEFSQSPVHHLNGHVSCKQCIQEKNKQTQRERYGVDHHTKTSEYREKVRCTSLERFGVEHHSKTPEFLDTMKQTSLEKYGVEFISQTAEFKQRVRETNRHRYGAPHRNSSHIPEAAQTILDDSETFRELLRKHSV